MRLGVYADVVYRVDNGNVYADRSFVVFVTGLAPTFELILFGRRYPGNARTHYLLSTDAVRLVPLPHYPRLTAIPALLRSLVRAKVEFERHLDDVDAVWLFGPHPLALVLTWSAWRRGVPVIQGIRQDWPRYIRGRLPNRRWLWAVGAAHIQEAISRLLARRLPTVVVGEEMGQRYGRGGGRILVTGFSLVRERDVVSIETALARSWSGRELRILTVSRLDAEKNVLLLPEILRLLRARDDRWRLAIAGEGPLEQELRDRADAIGVGDALELVGYVPVGESLWEHYRRSHVFLHVSLTEGLPQVIFEAQAAGLPIVATDVGGVAAALGHGSSGLLIPPESADAAASALERVRDDDRLRQRMVEAALSSVRTQTMEAQLDRLIAFFGEAIREHA